LGLLDGTERIDAPPQINLIPQANSAEIGTTIAGETTRPRTWTSSNFNIATRKNDATSQRLGALRDGVVGCGGGAD